MACVGTPQKDSGEADLSQVEAIARTIARNVNGYKFIVEKTTVPPITARWVKKTVTRFANMSAKDESRCNRCGVEPGVSPGGRAGHRRHFHHALFVLTPGQDYRELDWVRLRELMEVLVVVDKRNLLEPKHRERSIAKSRLVES